MAVGRNESCPCGSGKKYKHCCGSKSGIRRPDNRLLALGAVVLLAGGVVWGATFFTNRGKPLPTRERPPGPTPIGKVWSEEHGHYHDAPGERPVGATAGSAREGGIPPPPGPTPEGKVWSYEHGHWHNATAPAAETQPTRRTEPPGTPPPGKVWSEEHGHWHNAPAGSDNQSESKPSEAGQDSKVQDAAADTTGG